MNKYLILSAALCLSACGFHLKGTGGLDNALPYRSWAVEGSQMRQPLENALRRSGDVDLQAAKPEVTVRITGYDQKKDTSAINIGGNTLEYLLTLRVEAQAYRKGETLGAPILVQVHRHMDYADSEILGKREEEAQIWRDMQQDAARQLVRRLAYLPKR
ncbi:LPS-assembly lipoprotein [Neisseria sp. HSC-16F19]|nr:LPS assembly lipoprotein LptE [Neisseria sp. HSC-16F19]MCP2040671.1 LPS-assembly lipoprotein [Neisseria sp. HSC-16F19]